MCVRFGDIDRSGDLDSLVYPKPSKTIVSGVLMIIRRDCVALVYSFPLPLTTIVPSNIEQRAWFWLIPSKRLLVTYMILVKVSGANSQKWVLIVYLDGLSHSLHSSVILQ